MPELPEVESTVRRIRPALVGQEFAGAVVHWPRMVSTPSAEQLSATLTGLVVLDVTRHGKYIVVRLGGTRRRATEVRFLFIHLRMSGRLNVVPKSTPPHHHDRIVFRFRSGCELRFTDARKFGRVSLVEDRGAVLGELGPDALDPRVDSEWLLKALAKRRAKLKPLLLDQRFLAGLGNIYVDEILWDARLHPLQRSHLVTRAEAQRMIRAMRRVLPRAIEANGTDFGDGVIEYGQFRPRVYGREGFPCPRCKSIIERIVVGQRSTRICPTCQPLIGSEKNRR